MATVRPAFRYLQVSRLPATVVLTPVVALLWVAAVFDPVGKFLSIRFLALALALVGVILIGIPALLSRHNFRLGWREAAVVCTLLWLPGFGLLMYAIRGTDAAFTDTSYIAAGLLLTTTWLYADARGTARGVTVMLLCLRLLAASVIATYPILALAGDDAWLAPLSEGDVALFGFRQYGSVTLPYIYFLASPMLVFLVAYEAQALREYPTTRRMLSCGFAVFALGLSGTRAHLIIACLYLPVYFMATSNSKHRIAVRLASAIALTATLAAASPIIGEFLDAGETSNSMKLQALERYEEIFSDSAVLLFGQGFNAHTWSNPLQQMIATENDATKTELTYLELVRVFGVIGALPYFGLLVGLVLASARLPQQHAWFRPAFIVSLFNSSLNPYLFSTNGMLPMALLLGLIASNSVTINAKSANTKMCWPP